MMYGFIWHRKWKLAALGLFAIAFCIDFMAKDHAANAAIAAAQGRKTEFAHVADITAIIGLVVAIVAGICGVVSVVKAERGYVAPLLVFASIYLLMFLMLV